MESGSGGSNFVHAIEQRLSGYNVPLFEVVLPDGTSRRFGQGGQLSGANPRFTICLRTGQGLWALASFDEYAVAEAYIRGDIDVHGDFLAAFDLRKLFRDRHPLLALLRFFRRLFLGRVRSDKKAILNHYDRGNEFYWEFLDTKYRLYSQALYYSESESLEQAAHNKLRYIYESCRLKPGARVLDVGAGWGSFSRFAADQGADVTMLTLSKEQYKFLSNLAATVKGAGRMHVFLENIFKFRSDVRYDAIVLLGVMEHLPDYESLYEQFDKLLKPNGRVYMDFVATRQKYNISTFTHQYVFQGNHSPVVLPELLAASNGRPFEIITVKNDRHSYYLTVKAWAERLEAKRSELVGAYGETTFRLFQLYLWSVAHCLNRDGSLESYRMVFQKSLNSPSTVIGVDSRHEPGNLPVKEHFSRDLQAAH